MLRGLMLLLAGGVLIVLAVLLIGRLAGAVKPGQQRRDLDAGPPTPPAVRSVRSDQPVQPASSGPAASEPAPADDDALGVGLWHALFRAAAAEVTRYERVVSTIRAGSTHDWLTALEPDLRVGLDRARELALLGQSIAPDLTDPSTLGPSSPAHRTLESLTEMRDQLTSAADTAGEIAYELIEAGDLAAVEEQLRVIAEVARRLRE